MLTGFVLLLAVVGAWRIGELLVLRVERWRYEKKQRIEDEFFAQEEAAARKRADEAMQPLRDALAAGKAAGAEYVPHNGRNYRVRDGMPMMTDSEVRRADMWRRMTGQPESDDEPLEEKPFYERRPQ